jgi:hypothetical protein
LKRFIIDKLEVKISGSIATLDVIQDLCSLGECCIEGLKPILNPNTRNVIVRSVKDPAIFGFLIVALELPQGKVRSVIGLQMCESGVMEEDAMFPVKILLNFMLLSLFGMALPFCEILNLKKAHVY